MKFALVIYGSLDTVSGGYLYDRMLVNHFRAQGDTVDIISLPWRNYATHLTQNFSRSLQRQLNDTHYDLILQDELNHPSLFLANRAIRHASRQGAPLRISIVHHLRSSEQRPAWQNSFYRWIEKRYLKSVDGFIFNSHTTRTNVEQLIGKQLPHIVAFPGGDRLRTTITPEQIRQRATRPGPLKLLFVGNLIPRKGLHTLLDALAQIDSGWKLNVVGSSQSDPTYASQIRQTIDRRGLKDRVGLIGSLADSPLAEHFSHSDLLVVPSSYEGYGIVYLEGMAFGLPAIATTAGAASEIITPGKDGCLIEPNDSKTLAQHLRRLIDDRQLLLQLSLNARQRFESHPTWEQSMKAIREFLTRLPKS
jgi:glycosyltransferase involved in cell wall biosynthesis